MTEKEEKNGNISPPKDGNWEERKLPPADHGFWGGDMGVPEEDLVNHPSHYTSHPSGVECIRITEHMGFNLGNALKYVWRSDLKEDTEKDMNKAIWYIKRELKKRGLNITAE